MATKLSLLGLFYCNFGVAPLLIADELKEDDFQEFTFDDSLLLGGGYGESYLARFNTVGQATPGKYQVDIYINGTRVSRQIVDFVKEGENEIYPCLDANFWKISPVISTYINQELLDKQCQTPELTVNGATAKFDVERLKLDITIPQAYMQKSPRGYVHPELWNMGETAGYISYNTNLYQTNSSGNGGDMRAFYTGFNSGVNIGLWRLRNQSSYNYNDYDSSSKDNFNSIRTYAMRALPNIESELLLGDSYTRGNVLGSLPFTGFQLQTDNRMLPDSQRGYAPVVRGLANSTAKVVIKQNGIAIYQTTVAAGPFVINDLYPTSYEGDLIVEVTEADGKISDFTVPFSAVPGSIREGHSQYGLSAGEVNYLGSGNYFIDLNYEYGINNMLTLNSGGRVGEDYYALSLGTVLGTEWGAVGITAVHSFSRLSKEAGLDDWENGWRLGVNYSRSFETGTSVALAGYHYSTESFRELNDVLGVRKVLERSDIFTSETYKQRSEMSLSINQSLDDYGFLYVSGSKRQYRDGRDDDDQLQLGYSVNLGQWSLGLTFSRQYSSQVPVQYAYNDDYLNQLTDFNAPRTKEDLLSLTISIPLGTRQSNMLNMGASHSSRGMNSYNMGVSGTVLEDQSWTYGVNASLQSDDGTSKSLGVNTQKRFSQATLSGSYSIADSYQQMSAGISGAVVAHAGGLTLSQNLSDTFAIVEAKGANGAKVINSWGTEVNSAGYAVIPTLTPYRMNRVTLDSGNMLGQSELLETQQQIAPYAGAIVKLKFETREGYAVLFMTQKTNGGVIPIGAEVVDENGQVLGMVGQAGMAYIRAPASNGHLKVTWGELSEQACSFDYALSEAELSSELVRMPVNCQSSI
ncbi:fimbria/pilus outer membrane usher protein [Shewanella decolorationis]|uniref:fimbria/pilus outer membrane usher protein n=2 Tax=Shewanella decolorationis TaxID=256839 RepID=UPI001FB5B8FB|nr:fimbria/pilus outer membrane usher protein [Shewanella decolorationis]